MLRSLKHRMTSDAKRNHFGATVDRISVLPRNLIDLILECLPVHDAARTSVLSKTWKNIWGTQSQLVFDKKFFTQLVPKDNIHTQLLTVMKTINCILLLHSGPISKFHLFIPEDLPLHQCEDMDIWIKHISNNGVRILELFYKPPVEYKLPSYLFSCLELTNLSLDNCILHPPLQFKGFRNLKSVKLLDVTITADMSLGLQLEDLELERCYGIEHFGCQFNYNNNLTRLIIEQSGAIDWRWFEFTHKVKEFALMYECEGYINEKVINFDKLVDNMPEISVLHLDGYFLQLLELVAANSWKLTTAMENLEELNLYQIELYNLHQIQCVLCLIQSSPNLQFVHIGVENSQGDTMSVAAVEQYLQLPNFAHMIHDKLETVEIMGMVGSTDELHLIKILLASTPSLRCMKLNYNAACVDCQKELIIQRELLHFTRASTCARIILN